MPDFAVLLLFLFISILFSAYKFNAASGHFFYYHRPIFNNINAFLTDIKAPVVSKSPPLFTFPPFCRLMLFRWSSPLGLEQKVTRFYTALRKLGVFGFTILPSSQLSCYDFWWGNYSRISPSFTFLLICTFRAHQRRKVYNEVWVFILEM